MNPSVQSIVILVLMAHTPAAAMSIKTSARGEFTRLYTAAVDVLMTCYKYSSDAVGIVGDSEGSIIKTLRANYSIPIVLVDIVTKIGNSATGQNLNRLQNFLVVADSPKRFNAIMKELADSIWWNHNGNFLILNPTPDTNYQCLDIDRYLLAAFQKFGVLDAQFICLDRALNVSIFNSNPFIPQAPERWELFGRCGVTGLPISLFRRFYRRGEKTCEALNFVKTRDAGGSTFCFMTTSSSIAARLTNPYNESLTKFQNTAIERAMDKITQERIRWNLEIIVNRLNVTAYVTDNLQTPCRAILMEPFFLTGLPPHVIDSRIYILNPASLLATTQHTPHKSQLEKILSVIDQQSRNGMYFVYAITFLFFKLFLGQALVPAILNLVRLTTGVGLTKLPRNVAPKIYLACLFVFVVTLQAIYTGKLASLLTTTISHPHADTKEDFAKLGYKIYTLGDLRTKLSGDPVLEGQLVEVQDFDSCFRHVRADPLAACVADEFRILSYAGVNKLHVSRDSIKEEYVMHLTSANNPFKRRLESLFSTAFECHLNRYYEDSIESLRFDMVDDEDVKKNTFRRVMNLDDLCFAFVILGIGLTCSIVCFIGEIVVWRIRLKIAKRKDRSRRRFAWGVIENKSSICSAFKRKLDPLHLFSKRR